MVSRAWRGGGNVEWLLLRMGFFKGGDESILQLDDKHEIVVMVVNILKNTDLYYLFTYLFIFDCTHALWKFQGQGSYWHHSSNQSHKRDKTRSLSHWATRELLEMYTLNAWMWNACMWNTDHSSCLKIYSGKFLFFFLNKWISDHSNCFHYSKNQLLRKIKWITISFHIFFIIQS